MAERKKRIDAMKKIHGRLSTMEEERLAEEARSHSDTGDTFSRQNDYDNAIKEYTLAIRLHGTAACYANRGNCYFKKTSWAKALADYCEALRRESQNKTYQDLVSAGQEKMITTELWLAAIELSGYVFKFMPENLKTADFCRDAIVTNVHNFEYVPEAIKQSKNAKGIPFYHIAVKWNGLVLDHIPENLRTPELYRAAVQSNDFDLEYLPDSLSTPELYLAAVQESGDALMDVPEEFKTAELCLAAVMQNDGALKHVPEALKATVLTKLEKRGYDKTDCH
ncbi:hypothetical protein AGMMS49587_00430 [Spirochaetia bacterium]|nr:hypothetical protein AGMMS49587_00430 [Spirochaetia bacterium]